MLQELIVASPGLLAGAGGRVRVARQAAAPGEDPARVEAAGIGPTSQEEPQPA